MNEVIFKHATAYGIKNQGTDYGMYNINLLQFIHVSWRILKYSTVDGRPAREVCRSQRHLYLAHCFKLEA
jgi:hypothetical protein